MEFIDEAAKSLFKSVFAWQQEVNMDVEELNLRLKAKQKAVKRLEEEEDDDEEDGSCGDENGQDNYEYLRRGVNYNSVHSSEITDFGPSKPFNETKSRRSS